MIELLKEPEGIISIYEIPEEWAQDDELFKFWWQPKTELGSDHLYHIVEPARISDEAKAQRLVGPPLHNLFTTLGYTLHLTNLSVASQVAMFPVTQILSVGNGAISGVTRADTSVSGDGFVSGSRKAPATYSLVGFLTTINVNFASGDALGTWTNAGFYGFNVSSSQNASTATGTGALMTHALYPFVKGNSPYTVSYAFMMSN